MTFTPAALLTRLPTGKSAARLWVALSGGLDSMVLLHALVTLKLPVPLCALHVNHQISANANAWQQTCAAVCRRLAIPFVAETVSINRAGRGLEDAAREARYAVFEHYMQPGDVLLTAHHADDQAETVLLRLLRGTGPRGLAAMARQRPLGTGLLCRPLLDFSRAELETYAHEHRLVWVCDESNADVHYDRNYLRQAVTPLLQQRWPDFAQRWQQTAELCATNESLLEELAAEDLRHAGVKPARQGESISLEFLASLSVDRRHNLLRYWWRKEALALPEQSHLQQLETQIIHGRADARAEVQWGDLILRRYRDRLYVLPRNSPSSPATIDSPKSSMSINSLIEAHRSFEVVLASGARLLAEYYAAVPDSGYLRADLNNLEIRWRQGGERCKPQGRPHSQTVKNLLQEYGLEPWWREQLPIIHSDGDLAAVGDLWICEGFASMLGEPGYRLSWLLS